MSTPIQVGDTEVPILQQICSALGVPDSQITDSEVPLLQAIALNLGAGQEVYGQTEVPILQEICLAESVPANEITDSEIPLLTSWLEARLGGITFLAFQSECQSIGVDYNVVPGQTEVPLLGQILAAIIAGGSPLPPPTITSVTLDNTTPTEGDTITATVVGTNITTITYQWAANGVDIGGATGQSYVAASGDVGKALTCTAIAHNATGDSAPFTSAPTAAVAASDPLAGIPLSLRLQTHSGFGATPNAPIGLYQNYFAGARFNISALPPGSTSEFSVSIDGGVATATFSFSPSDPGDGSIYLGVASGDPVNDAGVLSAGINANLSANCSSTSDGSGNVVTTSFNLASTTSVSWTLPGFITVANNFPSVASPALPATADGDPVAAWADVLGTSGLIATQGDPTKQPVLRFTGGVPWIEWAGAQFLILPVPAQDLINANKTDVTVFALFKSSPTSTNVLIGSDIASPNRFIIHSPFSDGNTYFDVGDDTTGRVSGPLTWNSFAAGTFRRSGAQMDVWKDGVNSLTRSDASGNFGSSACYIGTNNSGAFLVGGTVAILDMAAASSIIERQTVENYFTNDLKP